MLAMLLRTTGPNNRYQLVAAHNQHSTKVSNFTNWASQILLNRAPSSKILMARLIKTCDSVSLQVQF